MHENAARVQRHLAAAGSRAEVVELSVSARTADEAAAALGVERGQIVKSLVFSCGGEPLLLLVAGDRRADPEKVGALLGAGPVERAHPELVREATGFPIGGVAPVAHLRRLRSFVDSSLRRFDRLWAAAGTPHAVFETEFDELVSLTGGLAADLTEPPAGSGATARRSEP